MDKKSMNHYKHLLEHHRERHQDIIDDMETLSLGENEHHARANFRAMITIRLK